MKKLLFTLLLLLPLTSQADMIIETIELHYRPTEEIIPLVTPMLDSDASITGTGYKLIIKSSPENIEQIKTLVTELDVDPTQLLIHVAINDKQQMQDSGASVNVQATNQGSSISIGNDRPTPASGGTPGTDSRIKYDARIFDNTQTRDQPVSQVVRVSEGYWATIQMGQSIPVTTRLRNPDGTVTETVNWQNVTRGFRVMPRTNGDQVTLTIMPHNDSFNPATPGRVNTSGMETTLTGKIGQWIHIGGTQEIIANDTSGISYRTRVRDSNQNQIWLKVERPQHGTQH